MDLVQSTVVGLYLIVFGCLLLGGLIQYYDRLELQERMEKLEESCVSEGSLNDCSELPECQGDFEVIELNEK